MSILRGYACFKMVNEIFAGNQLCNSLHLPATRLYGAAYCEDENGPQLGVWNWLSWRRGKEYSRALDPNLGYDNDYTNHCSARHLGNFIQSPDSCPVVSYHLCAVTDRSRGNDGDGKERLPLSHLSPRASLTRFARQYFNPFSPGNFAEKSPINS